MRLRSKVRARRGAALVELSVVLMLFLTLVLGMLDLGIGVFEYNIVSQVARAAARKAITHGYLAAYSSTMNAWGPTNYSGLTWTIPPSRSLYSSSTSYTVQADNTSDELASTIRPSLAGLDPGKVTIKVEWPDGDNQPEKRVRVTITYPFKPMMTFIFGNQTLWLSAVSEMTIAH
jgi:Flp pilus assembly protein TadG